MAATLLRLWQAWLVVAGALVLLSAGAEGQTKKQSKAAASPLLEEALAKAKKSQQPLVMFGVSPGCIRCAALKEGLTVQPELKELMAQYVSAEIPFGGKEFSTVYGDIIRQDAKYNQAIGAPSVFIFTSKGNVVYAGPNDPNGMQPGETFKKLLQEGITKNGGVKGADKAAVKKPVETTAAPSRPVINEPSTARLWKSKTGQFSVTATLISFDGKTARLKTTEGKTVNVSLEALSSEDQEYLRGQKTKD